VTWNVERGYRLGSLISELVAELPDLVFLQEVDCSCDRSFRNDVAGELALALGDFHVAFATEKDGVNGGGGNGGTSPRGAPANAVAAFAVAAPAAAAAAAAAAVDSTALAAPSSSFSQLSDRGTLVDSSNTEGLNHGVPADDASVIAANDSKEVDDESCEKRIECPDPKRAATPGEGPCVEPSEKLFETSSFTSSASSAPHVRLTHQGGVEGLAVLSRYPIRGVRALQLPNTYKASPSNGSHDKDLSSNGDTSRDEASNNGSSSGSSSSSGSAGGKARVALRVEVATPVSDASLLCSCRVCRKEEADKELVSYLFGIRKCALPIPRPFPISFTSSPSCQLGLVVGYSVHLDAFAGRTARVHQLQPVLEDAAITVIGLIDSVKIRQSLRKLCKPALFSRAHLTDMLLYFLIACIYSSALVRTFGCICLAIFFFRATGV